MEEYHEGEAQWLDEQLNDTGPLPASTAAKQSVSDVAEPLCASGQNAASDLAPKSVYTIDAQAATGSEQRQIETQEVVNIQVLLSVCWLDDHGHVNIQ